MKCPVCEGNGSVDDTVLYAELMFTSFGDVGAIKYTEPAEWWVGGGCPWGVRSAGKGMICDMCSWRVCDNQKSTGGVIKCQICDGSGEI